MKTNKVTALRLEFIVGKVDDELVSRVAIAQKGGDENDVLSNDVIAALCLMASKALRAVGNKASDGEVKKGDTVLAGVDNSFEHTVLLETLENLPESFAS